MKTKKEIDLLIQKYLDNQLTVEELDIFLELCNNSKYSFYLNHKLEKHWDLIMGTNEEDLPQPSLDNFSKIEKQIQPKKTYKLIVSLAASIAVILGGFFAFYKTNSLSSIDTTNQIVITLDDGSTKIIDHNTKSINQQVQLNLATDNTPNLVYQSSESHKKVRYNELKIPLGKQLDIVLFDGTKIKLNAGTHIKYPVDLGKKRLVTLYRGEAFFEVTHNTSHPFIVNNGSTSIEVVGTSFNISNYDPQQNMYTALVEGSVNISKNQSKQVYTLKPGQLAKTSTHNDLIDITSVDISDHIAWTKGLLKFKNLTFKAICERLERHFNVVITNNYTFLDSQVYTATFSTESLEEILESFQEDTEFDIIKNNANELILTHPKLKNQLPMK